MASLQMLQLASPSLPVGAFSYSEGLEWLVQKGKIKDDLTMFSWLESELLRGQIRVEAAALIPITNELELWSSKNMTIAKDAVIDWNNWLLALRDATTIRLQQLQMGRSLLQLLAELDHPLPDNSKDFALPIAWAWAGISWELSKSELLQSYIYSWTANQLSASIRLVPIGPTKAQALQSKLLPLINKQSKLLQKENPHQMWTGDVGATMAQLSHTELYSRLFRS